MSSASKGMMSYKGFGARIDYEDEDGLFVGRVAGINDVVGFHADTVAGLRAAFREAVDDYVRTCEIAGKRAEKTFSGNLMLRVEPEVHARAVLAAELSGKSLNQWGEEVLRSASERLSERA